MCFLLYAGMIVPAASYLFMLYYSFFFGRESTFGLVQELIRFEFESTIHKTDSSQFFYTLVYGIYSPSDVATSVFPQK